jgi:hypothetical protein
MEDLGVFVFTKDGVDLFQKAAKAAAYAEAVVKGRCLGGFISSRGNGYWQLR